MRKLLLAAVVGLVFIAGSAFWASPAFAQRENPNDIDWTISIPFIGTQGDQIPLRVGQNDFKIIGGEVVTIPGFGERHIIDGHGAVPPADVIDDVLQNGSCVSPSLERFVCTTDEAEVVFATNVDPRSGDNIPFGIITAYFRA